MAVVCIVTVVSTVSVTTRTFTFAVGTFFSVVAGCVGFGLAVAVARPAAFTFAVARPAAFGVEECVGEGFFDGVEDGCGDEDGDGWACIAPARTTFDWPLPLPPSFPLVSPTRLYCMF
jgi:hypothetical protein